MVYTNRWQDMQNFVYSFAYAINKRTHFNLYKVNDNISVLYECFV